MFNRYRAILTKKGALRFALAGLLSRMPMAMFNISVILMIQLQYDKWEIAGRVAAVGVAVWAAQTIPTARLVDRVGQAKGMWPLVAAFVVGTVIVGTTAMMRGPEPLLWVGAAIASLSGPVGSLTRARWAHILDTDDEVHTAFSLEGSLDEILFVLGPTLATLLAYNVHPASGLIVCTIGMLIGMTLLLAETSSEPPARRDTGGEGLGLKVPKSLIAVAVIALGLGSMFGAFDISTVAFAKSTGHESLGGAVLGIVSFGSFLGGLAYGAREWKSPLWKRLAATSVLLGVAMVILTQMPTLTLFTVVGFVAGATIAPAITSQDTIAQRVVPQHQLTEGMAWLRIGIGAGVAVGAWLGGKLIDTHGYTAGLKVTMWSAIALAVLALLGLPWIRKDLETAQDRKDSAAALP